MPDVKALRKALRDAKASWSLGEDLAESTLLTELAVHHLGALQAPDSMPTAFFPRMRQDKDAKVVPAVPGVNRLKRPLVPALPAAWDWRNVGGKNYLSPVRNQGGCGSCVAFATIAAAEAHHRIETNQPSEAIDLSEASLFFVANRQCNLGEPNYGWWVPSSLDAMVNEGCCFEAQYPYRPVTQVAHIPEGTTHTLKIRGWDSSGAAAQIKRWLVQDGPLVTRFTVYGDFFAFFNSGSGVYTHVSGDQVGGHAVCVIGYDDAKKAWICRNSWGSKPGHPDGCFLIGYGQCGIDDRIYVPQDVYDVYTVDAIPYDPRRLVVVNRGSLGWMLTDGNMSMRLFDTAEDARNGLRVARRYNRQCFVGRDNPRANRRDYILEFWSGRSGLPWEPLTRVDCIPYNPLNVVATDLDAQGWRLEEANHWMLIAHDMNDALAMLQVVERHSRMCFIGRGNTRPNRKDYIMTYFE